MGSFAIDTIFESTYYAGDTEEIKTTEALRARDRAQFVEAIKKELNRRPKIYSPSPIAQLATQRTSNSGECGRSEQR